MKLATIVFMLCMCVGQQVEAGELMYWPHRSGYYTEHLCALCDKRIHKYHESSWHTGDMMILPRESYVIAPSGSQAVSLEAETALLVCEECAKEWNGRYKATMKVHMEEFVKDARRMNSVLIEQNRKDNTVYKEKQDEIDRLRKRIQQLEMENWERQNSKTREWESFQWKAGTTRTPTHEEKMIQRIKEREKEVSK